MSNEMGLEVGGRLKCARIARGWTQARLAKRAGVSRETIYRVERGRMPTGDVASRLCDALGLDRGELDLRRRETDHIAHHPELALLRERRRSLGLTLAQCAAAAGVSVPTLSRFERATGHESLPIRPDLAPRAVEVLVEGLARTLGFGSAVELETFWRTGRLKDGTVWVP